LPRVLGGQNIRSTEDIQGAQGDVAGRSDGCRHQIKTRCQLRRGCAWRHVARHIDHYSFTLPGSDLSVRSLGRPEIIQFKVTVRNDAVNT
jgi:hypothetical protein